MDEQRRTQLIHGLVLMGAGKLIADGFDISVDEMKNVGHPMVEQGVNQLLKQQKLIGFTDQQLIEKAEKHVLEATQWIAKDLYGKKLAEVNIKHVIHQRLDKASPADRYSFKEFFPDKGGYGI